MYSIFVKIDAIEKRKRSTTVLHIIIGFFLLLKAPDYYRLGGFKNTFSLVLFLLVALFSLGYGFFKNRYDVEGKYNPPLRMAQAIAFALLGFFMIRHNSAVDYIGSFVWAGLCTVLLITEKKIFNDTNLLLDKKGITVPGYYREHFIEWIELSDIIVRQDYVTFFYKKGKYLQYQVLQSLSELEVVQINGFCKEQLTVSASGSTNN